MDRPTMDWLRQAITRSDVELTEVLEVGSMDVNGSIRPHIMRSRPLNYHGIDIAPGKGVDAVVSVHDLVKEFGREAFDVVVSTEMLEHVEDWKNAVQQMKAVLRPGGLLVLTTRAPGFPRHCYPHDHWRFTPGILRQTFLDFDVIDCRKVQACGVGMKARKPRAWNIRPTPAFPEAQPAPSRDLGRLGSRIWFLIAHRGRNPNATGDN